MGHLNSDIFVRFSPAVLFILSCLFGLSVGTELSSVTCGSVIKLLNVKHNVRLHSHDVRYGSGSGQQSVTGVSVVEDSNSYWSVRGTSGASCRRGTPVRCGQTIRLTHVNTGRNLHSHYFTSPLSSNQEVSAFGEEGEGDHLDEWAVQCGGSVWRRDEAVRFRHKSTEALLSVTGEQYGRPIHGQTEVHAMSGPTQHSLWKVMEGIFIKPSETPTGARDSSHTHRVLSFTSLCLALHLFSALANNPPSFF
ncbi:stromal cell-derived factor 2 [Austrofundulus limnaeus]|uniref:Stromal cell-derived factor 2 n=1 Tax=Austrofundulus limnaeus TaxID=52670 RepID=A0A2I4BX91_AUSLI|nr:PREDICTED: stromal cell-derived factor 2-like [Austrofundulus limnaeus]